MLEDLREKSRKGKNHGAKREDPLK